MRWDQYFAAGKSLPDAASKVLIDMQRPAGYGGLTLERLLCFWFAICSPESPQISPMSTVEIEGVRLHVFSASIYLRSLLDEFIHLDVPCIEERLRQLDILICRDDPQPNGAREAKSA